MVSDRDRDSIRAPYSWPVKGVGYIHMAVTADSFINDCSSLYFAAWQWRSQTSNISAFRHVCIVAGSFHTSWGVIANLWGLFRVPEPLIAIVHWHQLVALPISSKLRLFFGTRFVLSIYLLFLLAACLSFLYIPPSLTSHLASQP